MIKMLSVNKQMFFQVLALCTGTHVLMDAMFLRVYHLRDNVSIPTFLQTAASYVNYLTGHLQTWAEYSM